MGPALSPGAVAQEMAACAGLVLGLVNYQAVAAGTERVIR